MRILVTGFDPFGDEPVNPAWEAVRLLPDAIAGADIIKLQVPTVFEACFPAVEKAMERYAPSAVLSIGQAGGRSDVGVERVAINLADGRIPDNEGNLVVDATIREGGQNAYFATVPVKAMVERIRCGGVPASVSYTAGTYVCNYLMYRVLHSLAERGSGVRAGFIHIPYMPAQAIGKPAGTPSMSVETSAAAIEAAIEAIVMGATPDLPGDPREPDPMDPRADARA